MKKYEEKNVLMLTINWCPKWFNLYKLNAYGCPKSFNLYKLNF